MPTSAAVAAWAGVSMQTVSRVVNDRPLVAAATRERVRQAIAEFGYRPSQAARALAAHRPGRGRVGRTVMAEE